MEPHPVPSLRTCPVCVLQAFSSLAEAAYEATDAAKDMDEPSTYCLSSSFEIIVHKLLETTDRCVGAAGGSSCAQAC